MPPAFPNSPAPRSRPPSSPTSSSSSADGGGTSGNAGAGAGALAVTGDIPVGGCAVFTEAKCVVTQPSKGDFKAFTSVCTHQGCTVSAGTDGVIPCTCHGSQFSMEDGSVLQGPATAPLAAVAITARRVQRIMADDSLVDLRWRVGARPPL